MTGKPQEGRKAPAFTLETTHGKRRLADYAGKYLVLYFYPKDDTPGCTTQALDFTAQAKAFEAAGAAVLAVSRDSLPRHEKFASKHALTIELGSDEDGKVSDAYGTWEEKTLYGRTYMGMARRTFLIGPDGKIIRVWPKVRVKGHAAEVLENINSLTE
ncbi:MAG: peroxiredoxin [Hyphomonas sp.]